MGIFAIYDEEEGYARSFMEYVSEKKGLPFKIMAFGQKEALKGYTQNNRIDIMLIADKSLDEEILKMDIDQFVILSEGEETPLYAEYPRIYKYQSAENVLGEVIECYVNQKDEKDISSIIRGCQTDIIGVYSPVARSGKTSFALTLGQILLSEGPVLYINMEEFSGFRGIFSKEYRSDLSDLMYYYMQSPESVRVKLKAIVSDFHGMDCVPPMVYSGDIRNIKSRYWMQMFRDISDSGIYQNIILDLSSMAEDILQLLNLCDTIYMPVLSDKISMCKLSEYEEFLLRTEREDIMNKTVKVKVPHNKNNEWSDNYVEELLWGEVGDFIRQILNEDVAC